MSERRRVNISIDEVTYRRLVKIKEEHGFSNLCELVTAFVHILCDHVEEANERIYDLPDDDNRYIDGMFEELGHVERTPDGSVPKRHFKRNIKG